MRLYVAGTADTFVYCMAPNRSVAVKQLGSGVRVPDPDDIRRFWHLSNIGNMSAVEVKRNFGVTRQAVDQWHTKGGQDLPRRREFVVQQKQQRVKDLLVQNQKEAVATLAAQAGVSETYLRRAAADAGIEVGRKRQMPSDEELVELARGRTWREFAAAVGYSLGALRNHVYANKPLAAALRTVRRPAATGKVRIDIQKLQELGDQGLTAYAIAEVLGVEQMTVRAHLQKRRQERVNAAHDQRKTG